MSAAAPATVQERRTFWLLLLIAVVVIGAGIGLRDPWPSDEPRFTLVAKHMVESGDWLFPHRGSELYSDKPPMLFWLEAASYTGLGSWRIAFLLPSLLAALGCLLAVYDLGSRLWNRQVGLYAAAGLLITFQFVYQTKRAQIDPLVMFFLTAGNWGLLVHMLDGPNWRAYWLGCFSAGLGVITKGVGVLALLLVLPYLVAVLGRWQGVSRMGEGAWWRWLLGPVALLVAVALWLVPMLLGAKAHAGDPAYAAYVNDILFHQTAGRYGNSWDHHHSPLFYVPIVLFTWLPLSLTYPGTLPRWWRALKAKDARILLPLSWIVLVLVFFSIPRGKRDVYIMPALPMLALVTAPYLGELLRQRWLRIAGLVFIGVMGAAMLLVGGAALIAHPRFTTELASGRGFEDGGHALWLMMVTIGASQLLVVAALRVRHAVAAVAAGLAVMWVVWSLWAYPILNDSSSAAGVMQEVREHLAPGDQLGMVAWKEQNLLMLDHSAVDFGFTRPWRDQYAAAVAWQAQDPSRRWLFALDPALAQCVDRSKAVALGHANRREWWMFKADAVIPGCLPNEGVDRLPAAAQDD
ncbi:glycosyltransferase family 39 protein [Dyella solisilvae]|uniref:Glycosyltransferase family 39 protein n=1 Tax=Dyella solisilvae TaxID=1920168 RepID=A0A370K8K7_9GAMM|nr:glycosyltransferase family 39 protein [Dyella solisilvae]RDI98982.1 glycosyltransferase family 39 protein [Dyella solisilvae]